MARRRARRRWLYRGPGRLFVDLRAESLSRTQAQRLATEVAQALRAYDEWAPTLDVIVDCREVTHPIGVSAAS
ncbi:MAG TPA: hypothetical protein VMV14_02150 [Acidimicrobiales bacterium]|nr:hypothetical protein [Acidimicrobiales bacterium]